LRLGRYENEVETPFASQANGFASVHDTKLIVVLGNDANLGYTDTLIDGRYFSPVIGAASVAARTKCY
jgi:hypothetical protein